MKQDLDFHRALRQWTRDLALAGVSEVGTQPISAEALAALTSELSAMETPAVTSTSPSGETRVASADSVGPESSMVPWHKQAGLVASSHNEISLSNPTGPRAMPAGAVSESVLPTSSEMESVMAKARSIERTAANIELELTQWAKKVAACTRCTELALTRTQTVFGVGNPLAEVMFIGEAPGADEDATGEPFVGRAGQLLNKIIAACGWQREQLYICNILRCRPPGNRNPLPTEAANCREYLDTQIALVQPKYIVCWGTIAAQNLLGMTEPISKLRKKFFEYRQARVLCTYHPSYLLRNPAAKKDVWEDLQLLLVEMGVDLSKLPKPGK